VYRFVLHNGKRHPRDVGAREIQSFLTWLAVERNVAASTQNQALCALLFLYREVLQIELPRIEEAVRARRSRRVSTVLSRDGVRAVMAHLTGVHVVVGGLLYGGGLRLLEALRLREGRRFRAARRGGAAGEGRKGPHHLAPRAAASR
jgi:integrase